MANFHHLISNGVARTMSTENACMQNKGNHFSTEYTTSSRYSKTKGNHLVLGLLQEVGAVNVVRDVMHELAE